MKKIIYILCIAVASSFLSSCETESETSFLEISEDLGFVFTGSQGDIEAFLSSEAYNALLDLGITVNSGATPPIVSGAYLNSPNTLIGTNIPDDGFDIGQVFFDSRYTFSNQNNDDLTIGFRGESIDNDGNISSSSVASESFISGSGNSFTIIAKINGQSTDDDGNVIRTVQGVAISGTLSNGGIQSLQYGFIFIEKEGDVNGQFIDEGEGRLVADGDGFSERQ